MVLSFVRKLNMSPGLRDTGDVIDADDITELQVALEGVHNDPFGDASGTLPAVLTDLRASADGIQDGTLPIALAGIADALGAYADPNSASALGNMRRDIANVRDYASLAVGNNWTAAIRQRFVAGRGHDQLDRRCRDRRGELWTMISSYALNTMTEKE